MFDIAPTELLIVALVADGGGVSSPYEGGGLSSPSEGGVSGP